MAQIIVTDLTDAQVAILVDQNMTEYVASLANHLIIKKAEDEKSQLIKVLLAKTTTEITAAAKPILDAERVKADALAEAEVLPK